MTVPKPGFHPRWQSAEERLPRMRLGAVAIGSYWTTWMNRSGGYPSGRVHVEGAVDEGGVVVEGGIRRREAGRTYAVPSWLATSWHPSRPF